MWSLTSVVCGQSTQYMYICLSTELSLWLMQICRMWMVQNSRPCNDNTRDSQALLLTILSQFVKMGKKLSFCCPRLWPLWPKDGRLHKIKSVNIFLGFFFVVNFCLGTGFLGIPYAFFYAGYLAAIPTLLLIAFAAWNGGRWEIEVMARAQVRTDVW